MPVVSDFQFMEKFSATAINMQLKNILGHGVYVGFNHEIIGSDKVRIGDASGNNTASLEYNGVPLTINGQHPVVLVVPRNKRMTAVVTGFFQYGTITRQVDSRSNIEAAEIKLVDSTALEPHHVRLFEVFLPSVVDLKDIHINDEVMQRAGIANAPTYVEAGLWYVRRDKEATVSQIDAKVSGKQWISLSMLWRALAKVTSDANAYATARKAEAVNYTKGKHTEAIEAVNAARAQAATDATNKANKALVDAKAYTVTKHGEAVNHTNVEKGKTIASIKAWANGLFFTKSGGDVSGDIHVKKGRDQSSAIMLSEADGLHGAGVKYDGASSSNWLELYTWSSGVPQWVMRVARLSKNTMFAGEIFANEDKQVYHEGNKQTWEETGGNGYIKEAAGFLKIGANKWLQAASDNTGFLPAKPAKGGDATSMLGTSSWWFKEAWVNTYLGGSIKVTGLVQGSAFKGVRLIDSYGIQVAHFGVEGNTGNYFGCVDRWARLHAKDALIQVMDQNDKITRIYHDDYHPQADNADTLNNKNSAQIVDLAAQYTNSKHTEQQAYIIAEIAKIMGGITPDNLNSIVELIGKIEGNETAIDLIEKIQANKLDKYAESQTIDGGQSTTLHIKSNDNGISRLALYGEVQGTGDVYVGQSFATGGGFTYNGDGTPFVMDQVFSDHVVHYRKSNHVYSWVFRYSHNNSKVTYRNTPYVGEHAIFHKGNDGHGSGLDADTLDGSHVGDLIKKTELNGLVRAETVGGNYCYKHVYHHDNYQSVVILLQKKSVSIGAQRDSLSGKITLRRGGAQSGNSLISIGIDIQSAYLENHVQYIEYMDTRGTALSECLYNGEKWYCLCKYGNIQDNNITFIGTREGGSTHETDFLRVISFRGDGTQLGQGTVTNEEVNNSVKSVKPTRGVNFISAPTVNNIPVFCKDHPPAWEDVGGDSWWLQGENSSHNKNAKVWLSCGGDSPTNSGLLPNRKGTNSSSWSMIGLSSYWFREAWVNTYRGGKIDVEGAVAYNALRLVGNIDFNDYVRTESFNVYDTSTMANAPASGKYGTLHVIGSCTAYQSFVSQIFTERVTGEVWTRGKNDGQGDWSEWAKQYNTRCPPTAADVKAIPTSDRQNIINEAIKEGVPAGVPLPWASDTPPSGYAIMKGQAIAPEHTKLRALYGTNLKDMRGMAIVGTPSGVSVLSYQSDFVKSHGHTGSISSKDLGTKYSSYAGEHTHTNSRSNYTNDNVGMLSLGSDGKYGTYRSSSAGNHRHYTAMGSHNHGVTINKYGSAQNTIRNVKFNWIVRLA